jgi:hypothetical protein
MVDMTVVATHLFHGSTCHKAVDVINVSEPEALHMIDQGVATPTSGEPAQSAQLSPNKRCQCSGAGNW